MIKRTKKTNEPEKKLGEILKHHKIINSNQLKEALKIQKKTGKRVGEILFDMKIITQDQINWVLSKQLNIPYMNINIDNIDRNLSDHIPEITIRKYKILPIMELNGELVIAMADPTDNEAVKNIQDLIKHKLRFVLASYENIDEITNMIFENKR